MVWSCYHFRGPTNLAGGLAYSISEGLVGVEQLEVDNHHHILDCAARIGMQAESVSLMHPKDFHSHGTI